MTGIQSLCSVCSDNCKVASRRQCYHQTFHNTVTAKNKISSVDLYVPHQLYQNFSLGLAHLERHVCSLRLSNTLIRIPVYAILWINSTPSWKSKLHTAKLNLKQQALISALHGSLVSVKKSNINKIQSNINTFTKLYLIIKTRLTWHCESQNLQHQYSAQCPGKHDECEMAQTHVSCTEVCILD
jgi:hypothetical protein